MDSSFFDESTCLVHCVLTGFIYFAFKECQRVVNNFEHLQTYDVGKDLSSRLIVEQGTLPYVAIRGTVQPVNQPLQTSCGIPAVIQLLTSIDHYRSRFFSAAWNSSENLSTSTSVLVPFGLRDPKALSSSLVIVDEPDTADRFRNILATAGTIFEKAISPGVSSFVNSLTGKFQGTETTEKILPVGNLLTAIGKVTKLSNGSTHISNPQDPNFPFILTTLKIDDIRASYQRQLRTYKLGTVVLACIGGFFALKVVYKWMSFLCMSKMRRNIVKNRNPNGIEGLHDSQICLACLTNPREIIFIPCGHVCVCVDCFAKLDRCPVCREYIMYSYPAFIP